MNLFLEYHVASKVPSKIPQIYYNQVYLCECDAWASTSYLSTFTWIIGHSRAFNFEMLITKNAWFTLNIHVQGPEKAKSTSSLLLTLYS